VTVLAGRRTAPLTATEQAIGDEGGQAVVIATDVADEASVRGLFADALAVSGRLDLLFNNAGVYPEPLELAETTKAGWDEAVAVNLTGAFLCTREAIRLMRAQAPKGGRIINNGSLSAHVPRPRSVAYTATKHAITGLTRATALEGRAYDIACGQIDVGNAATDMTDRLAVGCEQADGRIAEEPRISVDRVGEAVAFMAGLPLDANVQFMTVMATKMPYIGRG
jgi:NAD(P)-dependent dehydrogenase (short-subunit alcohol dehydrogenase family)